MYITVELKIKLPPVRDQDEQDAWEDIIEDASEVVLHSNTTGDPVGVIKDIKVTEWAEDFDK